MAIMMTLSAVLTLHYDVILGALCRHVIMLLAVLTLPAKRSRVYKKGVGSIQSANPPRENIRGSIHCFIYFYLVLFSFI
jgi:hypothetical protein